MSLSRLKTSSFPERRRARRRSATRPQSSARAPRLARDMNVAALERVIDDVTSLDVLAEVRDEWPRMRAFRFVSVGFATNCDDACSVD